MCGATTRRPPSGRISSSQPSGSISRSAPSARAARMCRESLSSHRSAGSAAGGIAISAPLWSRKSRLSRISVRPLKGSEFWRPGFPLPAEGSPENPPAAEFSGGPLSSLEYSGAAESPGFPWVAEFSGFPGYSGRGSGTNPRFVPLPLWARKAARKRLTRCPRRFAGSPASRREGGPRFPSQAPSSTNSPRRDTARRPSPRPYPASRAGARCRE